MKKILVASVLACFLSLALIPFAAAEMAKEGQSSSKSTWITHYTLLPMGQERVQVNYEGYGIDLSEAEGDPLRHATAHVVGSAHSIKGRYENDSGLVCYTRPDGDQIFMTYKASGTAGKTGKGTYTFVGGTGKFVGIQGGGEFTRYYLPSPAKGVGATVNIAEGNWKIVEPSK
jgi:hypothetical protein